MCWFSFLFCRGRHPQGDFGDALAYATQCIEAAFVLPKLISLRLHGAAPMVARTPIANEHHSLREHEHDQLLQDQFHSRVASTANGDGTAHFVFQREAVLPKIEHSLEKLLQG